ncbi:sacsin [Chanos chanos]|uniref:Sacsin n=1 Tax=Chanos chanos TaxID=29144 RepID=A0A6J2WB11_CHACN|nr:sacsin-like [Chanos chanos]
MFAQCNFVIRNAFGASPPPFIDLLRDILRRYPDGGQILKELIQNADDAKATEVLFVHDERHYGKHNLWHDELGKYQGPALYAFNNAVFTEDDWRGIQTTCRSTKRDNPDKVGRFGIGFNSVYHVTDLPSVLSSKHLGLFDPQEKFFGDGEGGYQWSLDDEDDRDSLLSLSDQFQPFRDIVQQVTDYTWENIISERNFNGTLFRFPLRSEPSEISDNLYDSGKMRELFRSFSADADLSLLFLKNVSSISLMHIGKSGTINTELKLSASTEHEILHDQEESVDGRTYSRSVSCKSSGKETEIKWLMTTCRLKEGHSPQIDSLAKKLRYRCQVDAAFPYSEDRDILNGRLCCFLPLPNNESNKTGLPIHINACFGLTDNRRDIKWQEEDQKYDEAARWNELLVKELLPHTYLMIIMGAIHFSKQSFLPSSSVYHLWPDMNKIKHKNKWREVTTEMLKHLFQNKAVFCLAGNEDVWVTPSETVFPTRAIDPETMSAVTRVCTAQQENLVTIPDHVLEDVQCFFPEPDKIKWVTPSLIRDVLRRCEVEKLSKCDKLSLLGYVLSDAKYNELWGLKLLPLSDGSFKSFTNEDKNTALIDNEKFPRVLLPFCREMFLPYDLCSKVFHHLRQLAATGMYKVFNLDASNIAVFTKKSLPREWEDTQTHVTWKIGHQDHPPMNWLAEFWKYLSTQQLSDFIGMPVIPVEPLQSRNSSVSLARLQSKTTLIFQSSTQISLPDQIQKVVQRVGGTVIIKDKCLRHDDLDSYVLPPSPKSILKIFSNLKHNMVIRGVTSASKGEKDEIKSYFSTLNSLCHSELDVILTLPLFQLMTGEYVAARSKKAVVLSSAPFIPKDLPIPDTIVQCATEADRRLLTLLNIDLLEPAQLAVHLVDCFENIFFQRQEQQKIMTWILEHGGLLFSQSAELLRKCKDLEFIETGNGEHKKPAAVFDPTNKTFQDLLDVDSFPTSIYIRIPQMLESLARLGLQTKETDLSPTHILQVAEHIERLHIHSKKKMFKKADTLVRVLNGNDLLSKFTEQQIAQLLQIPWLPCKNPDAVDGENRDTQERSLYKPLEVRASEFSDIVGHVMPLTSDLRQGICQKLNLQSPPPAEKVIANLAALRSMALAMENPDSDVNFKRKLHSTYKYMQENIEDFRRKMNMKCIHWLWIQNQFVSPCDVFLAYPPELDLSLYIKKVPEEFCHYNNLLTEFGVKETLSAEEIKEILYDIKQIIDEREPSFGNFSELKVSTAILDWIRKHEIPVKDDIPVPVMEENQRFTLQPLSKTVFCDISSEGLDALRQDKEEFYVIHQEILPVTAKWLKIPFLSTRVLKPEFLGIEQFGQTEPITQRIKNILKEYDEESDIFKEVIQNAEDAGARTCRFMLDFRRHTDPPESLIDGGMELCNGPCLWIFNDELFSKEDWENIVKVGAATKENKIEKIGKFGVGFNAVYHVTDIPSILSGKNLLVLDPNVTHLQKHIHSKANPGIKLDLFQQRLFRMFPGQFRSYEGIFNCDLSKQSTQKFYQGTLIKLPFRTQAEADRSDISSKVYDQERIGSFQQVLTYNCQANLLFLKNINFLSLQILPGNAFTPPLDDQIQNIFTLSKGTVCTIDIPNEMQLTETQNESLQFLMKCNANCKKIIDFSAAAIVKLVQEHAEGTSIQHWLVYSCFGSKDSLQMFHSENHRCLFSLPVGGIAVPLKRECENGPWCPEEKSVAGQSFCFLPLSVETGLPVNVNGSFSITSNRKGLWDTGVKLDWNKALLQDAVTTAYVTLMLVLKKMVQSGKIENYPYYTFWPDREKVNKAFQPLVDAFYSSIAQKFNGRDLALFSNGKKWCSLKDARFLDPAIEKNEKVGALAMEVFLNNKETSYCAVSLPSWVRNSITQSGFSKMLQDRTFHWSEFYQVVFKNLDNIDPHNRNTLILNAIDLNVKTVDDLLKSHPCIPTQRGGKLQLIKKLVNPFGKVACLYKPSEGRFLEGAKTDFFSPKIIQRLSELGMLNDRLHMEDIIERAKTIPKVWEEDRLKAQKRLQCLFDLMRNCSEEEHTSHWNSLKDIAFIPVVPPLGKKHASALKKPSEIYNENCQHLVNMIEFTTDLSQLNIHAQDPVLRKLGIQESPSLETVLKQLQAAHEHSEMCDGSELLKIAYDCYLYLNEWLVEAQGDPTLIVVSASSFPFIFVEDKFVSVKTVAENTSFEARPYLYVLPKAFSKFRTLWECVGIPDQFTTEQFVAALGEMSGKGCHPLSDSDLQICLLILNWISSESDQAVDTSQKSCVLPDDKGVLRPSSQLHFNDSPWLPISDGITLCHRSISRHIAIHFGVNTTRHHTLQKLKFEFSPFSEEFGQHERLTVRLKNIIDTYPSKKDILKELIQNADDAKATEIHFVWDKRNHTTEETFGERWNLLHGPALCVYSNNVFTEADLKGIQKLGEGAKHGTLGRTGKYGLGFNSVYQLTDCPSILTGNRRLCIFDPNLKYVEGSTIRSPGIMYHVNKLFTDSFVDVYNTFLPSDFALPSGTMLRLPFRTKDMAAESEISKQEVSVSEIKELIAALSEDPEGLILFLRNIKKIQFHEISETKNKLTTIFSVEKTIPEKSSKELASFHKEVQNGLDSEKLVTPCKILYDVGISLSKQRKSQWVVAEQFGPSKQVSEMGNKDLYTGIPWVALAANTDGKTDQFNGVTFCSLPLPGNTGLPVHVNGNFEVGQSRRGLWKEDGGGLKMKWNQTLKLDIIAPLYADLLSHISSTVKREICYSIGSVGTHLNGSYLKFFPLVTENVGQDWHDMIHEVYRSIDERNLCVIPVLHIFTEKIGTQTMNKFHVKWSSLRKEPVNVPHFANDENEYIISELEAIGMQVVPCSSQMTKICNSFQSAHVEVKTVTPFTVREYLKKKTLNNSKQTGEELPLPIKQTLIKNRRRCSALLDYCMKDINEETLDNLSGLPLLLTHDDRLRTFSTYSPKHLTRLVKLFHGHEGDFADYKVNGEHIDKLQTGNYVKKLTIRSAAPYLKTILQELLQNCEVDHMINLYILDEVFKKWLKRLWDFFNSSEIGSKDGHVSSFNDMMTFLSDIPIVPVKSQTQNGKCVLGALKDLSSFLPDKPSETSSILFKLGILRLDLAFFTGYFGIVTPIKEQLLNPLEQDAVLDQIYNHPNLHFEKLSSSESDNLLLYFRNGTSKNQADYDRKLKTLPLFETIQGRRQRIDVSGELYILDVEILKLYPDLLLFGENDVFLENNELNKGFSGRMGIKILNDLEFYMQFILPNLNRLSTDQILKVVKVTVELQQKFSHLFRQSEEKIYSSLSKIKFIQDVNGQLQLASYFFDEDVHLYQVMLPRDKFIPQHFWEKIKSEPKADKRSIKALLKQLGFKHKVSKEEMITFALEIESGGKGNTKNLEERSKLLLEEILREPQKKEEKEYEQFIQRISLIKFIIPLKIQDDLCAFHPQCAGGQDRPTVSISGSLISCDPSHELLIWTSMPILPSYAYTPYQKKTLQLGGAETEPPFSKIAENLRNITGIECNDEKLIQIRTKVLEYSYAYLLRVNFDTAPLLDLPLVLVEGNTKLVKPSHTVLTIQNDSEFKPYLYQLPPALMLYKDFFQKIGVAPTPTLKHYSNVLSDIHKDSSLKGTLNANQRKTVKRSVEQLLCLMKNSKNTLTHEFPLPLYLPATDGKLYCSSSLYFNDTSFNKERLKNSLQKQKLKLLETLSHCHLGDDLYTHCELVKLLPEGARPLMLSHVIKQTESNIELCTYQENCPMKATFQEPLTSKYFLHGLVCLIRKQNSGADSQDKTIQMCQSTFSKIKIKCCEELETHLQMDQGPLPDSTITCTVFVRREEHGSTFFLKHNNELSPRIQNQIILSLTAEINALLENALSSDLLLCLHELLYCESMDDVNELLERKGIFQSAEQMENQNELPEPGSPIPEEWIDCLDMDLFNNFDEGEYVGFKRLSDEVYIYAIVLECVKSCRQQNTLTRLFKVQTGPEEIVEASSLDLYRIKRPNKRPNKTPETLNVNPCRDMVIKANKQEAPTGTPVAPKVHSPPHSLEEAKREIDRSLKEIWSLKIEDRQKAIHRLYLKWHPDKNPDWVDIATEAFKYLKNKINELELGQSGSCASGYSSGRSGFNWNAGNFYRQWDQEASYHRRGREYFYGKYSSRQYNFWSFHREEQHKPKPEEARRWYKQAKCDLNAAHNDTGGRSTEWCLFKIHQAVEKALIAAEYRKRGKHSNISSITSHAQQVSTYSPNLRSLPDIVKSLTALGVDAKTTQYPNYHRSPHIPNTQFKSENEKSALNKASELLKTIETYISV